MLCQLTRDTVSVTELIIYGVAVVFMILVQQQQQQQRNSHGK